MIHKIDCKIDFFLAIILLLLVSQAKAQNVSIPPSPTVASFMEYVMKPEGNFNGIPKIEIPLFVLEEKGFTMPISVSYLADGIKVDETASPIGLGWTLNVGGVITRKMNVMPDDYWEVDNGFSRRGLLHTGVLIDIEGFNPLNSNTTDIERYTKKYGNSEIGWRQDDTEPDAFYYSFNGYSGMFLFDKNNEIKLIPEDNVRIEYTLDDNHAISEFIIKTPDGTTYYFQTIEVVSSAVIKNGSRYTDDSYDGLGYSNSWHLTKVKTVYNEEVNFTYKDYSLIDDYTFQEEARGCTTNDCRTNSEYQFTRMVWLQDAKALESISSSKYYINFIEKEEPRLDLWGYGDQKALSDIEVYSQNNLNEPLKSFNFQTSYFISTGGETWSASTIRYYRLKLNSIQEYSALGNKKPAFEFLYNELEKLPPRHSFAQDMWGFYNENTVVTFIPQMYIYPDLKGSERFRISPKNNYVGTPYNLTTGSNREPKPEKMTLWSLNKISYPNGGYTKYDFEPHRYYYDGENYQGGGLRIQKITNSDGINSSNDIIVNYSYDDPYIIGASSGRLIYKPVFAYIDNSTYSFSAAALPISDLIDIDYNFDSENYYKYFLVRRSSSVSDFGIFPGDVIGYKYVTVDYGLNGKSIFKYSLPGYYNENNDCDVAGEEDCDCTFQEEGDCDELYSKATINNLISQCPGYKTDKLDIFEGNTYPFPMNTNYEWNRGLLLNKLDVDETGKEIKNISYTYKLYSKNGENIPTSVLGLKIGYQGSQRLCPSTLGRLYLFSKYEIVTGIRKVLDKSIEEVFTYQNGIKSSIKTEVSLFYNKSCQVSLKSIVNSDNAVSKTKYKYPHDYVWDDLPLNIPVNYNGYSSTLHDMVLKNQINSPVEVTQYKNELVIGSEFYNYIATTNGLIVPGILYSIYTSSPFTEPAVGLTSRSAMVDENVMNVYFSKSNQYIPSVYSTYNEQGNLIQALNSNDLPFSTIWGYNNTLPIAKATNAAFSEIFFTSYEANADFGAYISQKITTDRHSGSQCMRLPANGFNIAKDFTKSTLSGVYKYSAWVKTSGTGTVLVIKDLADGSPWLTTQVPNTSSQWQYFQVEADISSAAFNGCTTVRVEIWNNGTLNSYVDDVRFQPVDAQMTTYTYTPLIGITSETDARNRTTYYNYDDFSRLRLVKDNDGNVLKKYEYHYGAQ